MRNKVLKLISAIILLIILLIPSNVFAATTQTHWYISTSSYSNASVGKSSSRIGYYFGPNVYYDRFYNTFFHQINDGDNKYLAYCLDANWKTLNNSSGSIYNSDDTTLVDAQGSNVTGERLQLLKNVMAAGKQQGHYISAEQFKNKSTSLEKKSYLATQIIIWEIMSGGRTDYVPEVLNTPSGYKNSYDFVSTDAQLLNEYKTILSNAYELSDSGKPLSFGKTYILKWNDTQKKYISDPINIGSYKYDNADNNIVISDPDENNNITISSNSEINNETTLNFNFIYGMSLNQKFSWFKFDATGNNQRMLLAYYQGNNSASLSVKTEEGSFSIVKKDAETNTNIKGAIFDMYKCDSSNTCNTKVHTIDMTNKEVSDEIRINKSGMYKFVEKVTPIGYEKIPDFLVNFDIQDDGSVKISVDSNYADYFTSTNKKSQFCIYNMSKNFTISKISGNESEYGKKITGAEFQIKKSDGTVVKFNKVSDGIYKYGEDGTEDILVSQSLNKYTVFGLPIGEYILEEIGVPEPYVLSSSESNRQKKFRIDEFDFLQVLNSNNKFVKAVDANITVKNYKSRVTINKTGSNGNVIEGVEFKLYDSNKENQIMLDYSDGEYTYDRFGSDMTLVTNYDGKIVINSLPEGTYYLKEISTPDPDFIIDSNNQWTKIDVILNENSDNKLVTIFNSKKSFCFYKIDENGNYLDKGKFKLQVYNDNTSKFEDAALIQNEDRTFRIDKTNESDIYTFSPISGGHTCFVDLDIKSRYKVIELEAPEGFVLPNNQADIETEISINEYGYASGDAVIINKKVTIEDAQAQAELIIGISTGMDRINYVLIIIGIILLIALLIFIKRKMDKK